MSESKSHDPMIGLTTSAEIISLHLDSCDLKLATGHKARLYQQDSIAWKDTLLMNEIPEYCVGKQLSVLVTHRRSEDKNIYFVHERWAKNNPWDNLSLKEGDIVRGQVVRPIHKAEKLAGYFVQLDTDPSINEEDERSNLKQLDIRVYLPIEELPWANGSTDDTPSPAHTPRLELWLEDWVELEIIEIPTLPLFPVGSLLKRIHSRDTEFLHDIQATGLGNYLHEQLYRKSPSSEVRVTDTGIDKTLKPLHQHTIIVVDDNEDKLEHLSRLLQDNGAQVTPVLAYKKKLTDLAHTLAANIESQSYDLILVDYALPHNYQGIHLIELVLEKINQATNPPYFCLISTYLEPSEITYAHKKIPELKGCLIRPIRIEQVQQLCKGMKADAKSNHLYDNVSAINQPVQALDINQLLHELVSSGHADFIALLKIDRRGTLHLHGKAGIVPFSESQLETIAQETEIRVLLRKKLDKISIHDKDRNETFSPLLSGNKIKFAQWCRVSINQQHDFILGLGSQNTYIEDHDLLRRLIQQYLAADAWQAWALHHANFISSGTVVHSLAHEYRNYLNRLMTLSNVMNKACEYDDANRIKKLAVNLKEQTKDLKDLTDTLLQGLSQREESTSIDELLHNIERLVKPAFRESGTTLYIKPAPAISLGVSRSALIIPLVNLLLNGDKHHYRTEARMVSLTTHLSRHGNTLEFLVRDNGSGIHTNAVETLFQAGFSDAPDTRQQHGIGLWLSAQILKDVDGTLELTENLQGLGCCFRLTLPLTLA